MQGVCNDKVHRINNLASDMDALYHQAARKLGLADSELIVLYAIYERGNSCLLYDICRESGASKQTINSAIRKLENAGALYLEKDKGKNKRVFLTAKGKQLTMRTAARLFEAECNVFMSWTEEEFETYLLLMGKYNRAFRAELAKIEEQKL